MKKQNFKIRIDKPCKEDWNSMIENGIERYCSSCSRSVLDFTQMSDQQITDYLSSSKSKFCGRFTNLQVQKEYSSRVLESSSNYFSKLFSGLLLLSPFDNAISKDSNFKFEIIDNLHISKISEQSKKYLNPSSEVINDSTRYLIEGIVIIEPDNYPLIGAIVSIKNSSISTLTDFDGNFQLLIPIDSIKDQVIIVIKYTGIEEKEYSFKTNEFPLSKQSMLVKASPALIGQVCIIEKKKWWQFWKR